MVKRVLMLGASGKLGRMLRAIWAQRTLQEYEIIPVFRTETRVPNSVTWQLGADAAVLPRVSSILSLWGVTRGDETALAKNSELGVEAMELGKVLGADQVIHASTQAVYEPVERFIAEDGVLRPANAYGRSKLAAEHAVEAWCHTNPDGPRAVHMRIGNVAGAESLFANLKPGGVVTLDQFSDGTGPSRSYIAPQDLATSVEGLLCGELDGPINVAAQKTTPMEEIARAAGATVHWKPAPEAALHALSLDTSKLQSIVSLSDDAADPMHLVKSAKSTGVWP